MSELIGRVTWFAFKGFALPPEEIVIDGTVYDRLQPVPSRVMCLTTDKDRLDPYVERRRDGV